MTLTRRIALQRRAPLQGGGPLPRTPMKRKRRQPAVPAGVLAMLAARSGGVCELALAVCGGRAIDPSHRITQKMGGRHGEAKSLHDRLSDLLHSCRPCHVLITREPAWAGSLGLVLREGADTAAEPVLTRHHARRVLLDDAGGWRPVPAEVAS